MELVSQTLSHSFSVEARPFRRAKLAGSENGALPMVRQKRGYKQAVVLIPAKAVLGYSATLSVNSKLAARCMFSESASRNSCSAAPTSALSPAKRTSQVLIRPGTSCVNDKTPGIGLTA